MTGFPRHFIFLARSVMPRERSERPEHSPFGFEWLVDTYKRDIESFGPDGREQLRQAFAEGKITGLLRTLAGQRFEIPVRMWDKEPVEQKVYARFEDGWMRILMPSGGYAKGWVFVPVGSLKEALVPPQEKPQAKQHPPQNNQHPKGVELEDVEAIGLAVAPAQEELPTEGKQPDKSPGAYSEPPTPSPPNRRGGRRPGSGTYEETKILEEMHEMLSDGGAVSIPAAVKAIMPNDDKIDAAIKRLRRKYKAEYGDN